MTTRSEKSESSSWWVITYVIDYNWLAPLIYRLRVRCSYREIPADAAGAGGLSSSCNGSPAFCALPYNETTFPGSHNAGTGEESRNLDCAFKNHDLDIWEQLDLGIRFFDFDIIYRYNNNSIFEKKLSHIFTNNLFFLATATFTAMALRRGTGSTPATASTSASAASRRSSFGWAGGWEETRGRW